MRLPINGRVAIIDDQLRHAEPLMKVFSQKQIPFTYFSGEYNYLPSIETNKNDIRVLFLDINLIDDGEHQDKVLKGKLLPVLKSVISEENYPYIIIYWSRHQTKRDKNLIEKEIFGKELKGRRPIAFLSAIKSDYFDLDGEVTEDFNHRISTLFENIDNLLSKHPAYSYLLNWENKIHQSADKTLEQIFSGYGAFDSWKDNANYIINKLGLSFSGKSYINQKPEDKIKSSYNALNTIFSDTIERALNNSSIQDAKNLKFSISPTNLDTIYTINKKLLISDEIEPVHYSGTIIKILDWNLNGEYENLLDKVLRNEKNKEEIKGSWIKIWLNVTPLCDTVQGKVIFHRFIRGILVPQRFSKSFHSNEAIYVSPSFSYSDGNYCIVIDFRHFFTLSHLRKSKNRSPLFRIRQQLLAEIQSKLSRHISRQGILFLDDK